jgi:IclR family transcriptional regulator, acetate operon repressor
METRTGGIVVAGGVQSVDRVFHLLEHLADGGGSMSLSDLARRTDLPMPTIHRLLRSMVNRGYVRQESSKRYALGPRMIRLGESASRMLGSWATPHLVGLVAKYGETANMAMMEGDACVYVAQVPSQQSMRMFTEVGRVVMLHCTGVGKALLSTLSDEQVIATLKRTGMPARTEHTITHPQTMLEALAEIRKRGYAVDDGEQELGVRCVAVPIKELPFAAALSVSGPSGRITLDQVPLIAPDMQAAAADLATAFNASIEFAASG